MSIEYKDMASYFDLGGHFTPSSIPAGLDLGILVHRVVFDRIGLSTDGGVIHLGAHVGQEIASYVQLGFKRIVLVEPQPREFQLLEARVRSVERFLRQLNQFHFETEGPVAIRCLQCAVSDREGEMSFYRMARSEWSSLMEPDKDVFLEDWKNRRIFVKWYLRPLMWLRFRQRLRRIEKINIRSVTLDGLFEELRGEWQPRDFSYLRMNVQGSELLALRGGETTLESLQAIHLETDLEARYRGLPSKQDFDRFLEARGFVCALAYKSHSLGNLFYVRRSLLL
jgi:FkbM family methyltransferase